MNSDSIALFKERFNQFTNRDGITPFMSQSEIAISIFLKAFLLSFIELQKEVISIAFGDSIECVCKGIPLLWFGNYNFQSYI